MNYPKLDISYFALWLANGERGTSSEAIVQHLTGVPVGRYSIPGSHPYDPDDFRRCERLLRAYPLARFSFPAMRTVSPTWAALVPAWDELVALMESEAPGVFDQSPRGARCPLAYARIKELLDGARV